MALIPKIAPIQGPWPLPYTKSTAWTFPLYFQLSYLPTSLAKHCLDFPFYFQLPYLPTSLAKHCLDFSFVFSAPLPAYWPWAQISNHGRACTQALLLYKRPRTHCTVSTGQFLCVGDGSQRAICSCLLGSSPSLEDSSFVKTWVLSSCTFCSPLLLCSVLCFIGLVLDIVFRFIIEYSSLMDFDP
jgi:hypothetical protein